VFIQNFSSKNSHKKLQRAEFEVVGMGTGCLKTIVGVKKINDLANGDVFLDNSDPAVFHFTSHISSTFYDPTVSIAKRSFGEIAVYIPKKTTSNLLKICIIFSRKRVCPCNLKNISSYFFRTKSKQFVIRIFISSDSGSKLSIALVCGTPSS
jgi:hypothetical protein